MKSITYRVEKSNLPISKDAKTKIVIDANFLFIPAQFNIDIFEELANLLNQRFEAILLSSTLKELQGLAKSTSSKVSKQAELGIRMSEKCRLFSVEKRETETYDDVIVRVATEWKCVVATNDKALRKRLQAAGVPVILLRQKHRLVLEGSV